MGMGIPRPILDRPRDVVDRGGRRGSVPVPRSHDPAGDEAGPLPIGVEIAPAPPSVSGGDRTFDEFLRETDTLSFLVVDDDELVYERYLDGADTDARQTSFSVAKSFVSTLVGSRSTRA
jgi:hypothetical protein